MGNEGKASSGALAEAAVDYVEINLEVMSQCDTVGISGTTILVPYLEVKSQQLIWRLAPIMGGFPSKWASTANLWCFFIVTVSLEKLLNKQSSWLRD